MDVHTDLLQQACVLQGLSAAQDGVPDDGIVFPKEFGGKGLSDRLLLEISQ
jgi:hypothetical protein